MTVLTFTNYVDRDAASLNDRVSSLASAAPDGVSIDVAELSESFSKVVVSFPWAPEDEAARRDTTLRAARYAGAVFTVAEAA